VARLVPGWLLRPRAAVRFVTSVSPDSRPDLAAELATLASSVAGEAAELLMSRRGRVGLVRTKSSPTDVVTEMDRAAEDLIRDRLLAARPGDAFLGEEGGQYDSGAAGGSGGSSPLASTAGGSGGSSPLASTAGGSGGSSPLASTVRWVVDPIDGTVNYLYGLPDWGVSIAAEVAGEIVAGAVCLPTRRVLFSAACGGGAWLETSSPPGRQRLSCNAGVPLAAALVATGFAYGAAQRASQGRVVAAVLPRVRDIRRSGSAASDLCSVASGQVDAYYERGLKYWDLAAGALIAREAGAMTGGLRGEAAGTAMTIAASPGLFAELHDLLASLDEDATGG
jgi:myo-inositol-1(or 4)-monophosphatase